VRLECIAYSSYLDPPEKAAIDPSVLVDFCPIGQCFEVQINNAGNPANSKYAAALQAWAKSFGGDISIYSYYRKYAWHSLPTQIAHYMQNDLRYYLSQRVKGISTYAEPGDWFTYELNHYVLSQLAWDPNVDVDGLMNDFCAARYGPEAALARETFDVMEDVVRRACSLPGTSLKSPAEYDGFLARLVAQRKQIVEAQKRHERDDRLAAHLGRLDLMLEYAARDAAIQQHRAAGKPQQERIALVDALTDFLEQNANKGVFIHRVSFGKDRIYKRYGIEAK
jgi:hypothetical protein